MSKQREWGGKRQGSGRPPTLQNPVRITIWITAEQLAWIEARGEKSIVIRQLIDEVRDDTTK